MKLPKYALKSLRQKSKRTKNGEFLNPKQILGSTRSCLGKNFILPCLEHVINLIARKVVLSLEEDDDNAELVTGDEEEIFFFQP